MVVDAAVLDARDFIHYHAGRKLTELPPRKVVPHLSGLLKRGLVASNTNGAFFCQCAACKEMMPCCLGFGTERGKCLGCKKAVAHAR